MVSTQKYRQFNQNIIEQKYINRKCTIDTMKCEKLIMSDLFVHRIQNRRRKSNVVDGGDTVLQGTIANVC
jgi:hypothetical protein